MKIPTTEVKGMVEAVSQKSGGILIMGTWYNATNVTRNYVANVKKGEEVILSVDDKNNIHFFKKDHTVEVVDESKAIDIENHVIEIGKVVPNLNDRIFKAQCLNIASEFVCKRIAENEKVDTNVFIEMIYNVAKQIFERGKQEGF